MTYSLGRSAVAAMTPLVPLVQSENWLGVQNYLYGTSWCTTNNGRCVRDAQQIGLGCTPPVPPLLKQ